MVAELGGALARAKAGRLHAACKDPWRAMNNSQAKAPLVAKLPGGGFATSETRLEYHIANMDSASRLAAPMAAGRRTSRARRRPGRCSAKNAASQCRAALGAAPPAGSAAAAGSSVSRTGPAMPRNDSFINLIPFKMQMDMAAPGGAALAGSAAAALAVVYLITDPAMPERKVLRKQAEDVMLMTEFAGVVGICRGHEHHQPTRCCRSGHATRPAAIACPFPRDIDVNNAYIQPPRSRTCSASGWPGGAVGALPKMRYHITDSEV